MDTKQKNILYGIYDKFRIFGNKKFIQFRNLKEFNYFQIERVNPNHRIILYGKLKRKYANDGYSNKIIKAGEIILFISFIISPYTNILIEVSYCLILSLLLNSLFDKKTPIEVLNACWNRGITG